MFREDYLLNPFNLKTSTDEELSIAIDNLVRQYRNSETATDIAFNITLEANLLVIYGEFIARLQEQVSMLKLDVDNQEDKAKYTLRKNWLDMNINDKAPAMSYFEAQARELVIDQRKKQIKAESMLTRFKKCYESLETKQNALKKKLEAMRYEVS